MRDSTDEVTTVEVLVTTPATFECPVVNAVGVDLSWTRHEVPVVAGMDNVQILAGGRHLHISAVQRHDAGSFICYAKVIIYRKFIDPKFGYIFRMMLDKQAKSINSLY
jgi:hypothetical protein